ncbi:DUF1049 domain-containing protein [Streptomyces sp. NPDC058914]|uniref:DUF1049 domain-containing protein n=1 Tax=Streptomyces TaxID=1883 RepID=UPI003679A9A7
MSPKTAERGVKAGRRRPELTPARITVLTPAVLVLVFVFENRGRTEIRLPVPVVTTPLWVALPATALIGAVCGARLGCLRKRRR